MMKHRTIQLATLFIALLATNAALAHTGDHAAGGLLYGLAHPLSGLDHLVAMFAAGLWVASQRTQRIGILPVVVIAAAVAAGSVLATQGIALPGIEAGIALSVLVAGLLLIALCRVSAAGGLTLLAGFAVFHGQAHGLEMPAATTPLLYGAGFVLSTTALLLAGIGLGKGILRLREEWMIRSAGVLSGGLGAWLLLGA